MAGVMTELAASTLLALDERQEATLTELARITGRPVSSVQRAIDGLVKGGALIRERGRGRLSIAPSAPRRALLELAEWTLGRERAGHLRHTARREDRGRSFRPPASIANPAIRQAWPVAIEVIVERFHPAKVLLFGSQARGTASTESDVDLLVVLDEIGDKRGEQIAIRRALAGMPFAKDILVTTPDEIADPTPGTAIKGALRDAIVVYER